VSSELQDQAVRELKECCPRAKIVSHKLKWRNYSFEKSLPNGHLPFLKVKMETAERLPVGVKGQAFSHLFGGQSSVLEQFVLKCRLKGPGWVRLQSGTFTPPGTRLSFCSWEYQVSAESFDIVKTVEDAQRAEQAGMPKSIPPLKVLSLNMQTAQRSQQHGHEPLVVAMTLHSAFDVESADGDRHLTRGVGKWLGIRRLDTQPLPRDAEKLLASRGVQSFSSEAHFLLAALTRVCDFDPDVIVGQNLYGFDLDVLASRLHANKIQCWQKFGRLRRPRQSVPRTDGRQGIGFWAGSSLAVGRLLLDMNLQAKELLPRLNSYDLSALAKEVLKVNTAGAVQPEVLLHSYDSSKGLVSLLEATLQNSLCLVQLMSRLQILPLTKQLTSLAGSFWNGSLQNKRAERNELLLCHEFHKRKFVLPDKEVFASRRRQANESGEVGAGPRRQKAMYSGGLVLEPKVGLYDDFVMMLDFNSLYPSIIQEHNICFTTVDRPDEVEVDNFTSEGELLARTQLPDGMASEGVLPQVVRRLVESRREVKNAMKSEKDDHKTKMLDIKQRALKLTANSMYGCLGFTSSRFHARPLAALITCKGREALQSTISIVTQELQLDVVYGDTDSVFVNSKLKDYDHAMQLAQQIKRAVNKRYKKLEIEVDGMFSRLLLLKKKRYAGVKMTDPGRQLEWELKGLDIVRRDWCGLAKDVGDSILKHILTGDSTDEPAHWVGHLLSDTVRELDAGTVPLNKFAITKSITKAPKDYPDAKHQPHVQVALRLMARGKAVSAGQDIPYIIVADSEDSKSSFAERARHPEEFDLDQTLKVDTLWYKSQQIHPVVSRLLECVEGMDRARIAECLGLDSARYSAAAVVASVPVDGAFASDISSLVDRSLRWTKYTSCLEGLPIQNVVTPWKDIFCGPQSPELFDSCGGPKQVQNMFVLRLRRLLQMYSEGWVTSTASERQAKTRRMRRYASDFNEQALLQELEYLEHICTEAKSSESIQVQEAAAQMQALCHFLLKSNGCFWVDCRELFASAKVSPK
jgi:DNA polymerase alpha subunit A